MTTKVKEHNGKELFLAEFDRKKPHWSSNGNSWLMPVREEAIARFAELGIPDLKDEEWRNTNLAPLSKAAFSPSTVLELSSGQAKELERYRVDSNAVAQLVFYNGCYQAAHSTIGDLPKGVRVGSLAELICNEPDTVKEHLGKQISFQTNPFIGLNTAFLEDGAFISVPRGVVVERTIELLFVSGGGNTVSFPRNLIVAGENSQVRIIESYVGLDDSAYFTNSVSEVVAEQNAVVDHYKIQREGLNAFHFSNFGVRQQRSSNFSTHSILIGGRLVRNDISSLLNDEDGECTINGLYMPCGEQHIDNHTFIDHAKPHCRSHELYKGILDDSASGVFNGRIMVREDAQKTDAVQANHSLLLNKKAKINTRPQLEIFADDVKCTHGATIGELDDNAIFYLRSRGIPEEQARALIISAFVTEVVDEMRCETVRHYVQGIVEERFQRNRSNGEK